MTISKFKIIGFLISLALMALVIVSNSSCSYKAYGKGCGGAAKPIYHYKHKAI